MQTMRKLLSRRPQSSGGIHERLIPNGASPVRQYSATQSSAVPEAGEKTGAALLCEKLKERFPEQEIDNAKIGEAIAEALSLPSELTPLQKINPLNISHIINKVKDGKTLTKGEQKTFSKALLKRHITLPSIAKKLLPKEKQDAGDVNKVMDFIKESFGIKGEIPEYTPKEDPFKLYEKFLAPQPATQESHGRQADVQVGDAFDFFNNLFG